MKTVLVVNTEDKSIPSCLTQRAADKESYRNGYHAVHHITDAIRDEVLSRLNAKLVPRDIDFNVPNWDVHQAKELGYAKALREVLELLP